MNVRFLLLIALVLPLGGCASWFQLTPVDRVDRVRLERAVAVNADHAHAHLLLGRADLRVGEPSRALDAFRRAMAADDRIEEAWAGAGVALMDLDRLGAAREHYDAMAQRFPRSAVAHEGLAAVALQRRDLETARAHVADALDRDPAAAPAFFYLGEIEYASGNLSEAVVAWQRAVALNPEYAPRLKSMLADLEAYLKKYPDL